MTGDGDFADLLRALRALRGAASWASSTETTTKVEPADREIAGTAVGSLLAFGRWVEDEQPPLAWPPAALRIEGDGDLVVEEDFATRVTTGGGNDVVLLGHLREPCRLRARARSLGADGPV
jgi:hypothetical protein